MRFATLPVIFENGVSRFDVVVDDVSAIEQPARPGDHFRIVCGGAVLRVHGESYATLRELWIARRRAQA